MGDGKVSKAPMDECKHDGETKMDPWSYRCVKCGVDMCTDCGCMPSHPDMEGIVQYCRRCGEKGGHRYAFYTEVDNDKLRALVGNVAAASIIEGCRYD